MSAAIAVRDLFHVYSTPEGETAALQGLSLAVDEREVLVVLGPSGSGKSTLLRILATLDRPSAGAVRVLGADLRRLGGRGLARYRSRTLGYVEQHYTRSLDPELTARELVAVQLGLAGVRRQVRIRRADELLERVGLEEKRASRPAELSGGEQQRVAVCAALAHRPRVLFADEPTGELDAASADLVYRLIGELAREHECTTVVVSHDPRSAAIADRTIRVRDGRVSEEAARGAGGEEAIVIGRGGWLRLPEELLLRAGIGSRALAHLGETGVVVSSAEPATAAVEGPRSAAALTDARPRGDVVARVRALTKRYGSATVLGDVTATFAAGRMVAITGPSGSGKTTLLHLLAGLQDPSEGEIEALGVGLAALGRSERAALRREHVALIGQQPGLVPFLSARENVEVGLALRQIAAGEARDRALEALAVLGLAERAEQRVSRLSAGERQRVAIARALAVRAPLLLADEPTARLDEVNALAIGTLFARLARSFGTAVVCATHDPLVIEQADETVALG
jgi:ABC-type lipoprotein export system ATPase subunit